jgi:hypothetical protein
MTRAIWLTPEEEAARQKKHHEARTDLFDGFGTLKRLAYYVQWPKTLKELGGLMNCSPAKVKKMLGQLTTYGYRIEGTLTSTGAAGPRPRVYVAKVIGKVP